MVELTPTERRAQQQSILATPPRSYGLEAKSIFWLEDRVWGRRRTLSKFKAQELVARSPYRAWQHDDPGDFTAREEAANERSHRTVIKELMVEDGVHDNSFRFVFLPALGAAAMYWFTRVQQRLNPKHNYQLNADIEDHAEHEYARFIQEHPEWESHPYVGNSPYGSYESRAEVLRQICCDEHVHKQRSIARAAQDRTPSDS